MNFLAHVFLSEHDFELALGNLIADQIKGKGFDQFSPKVKAGILLHRKIDDYTDHHPAFRSCVKKLFPRYRHYSRVLVDMFFDHFLAKNWQQYHNQKLTDFTTRFYYFLLKKEYSIPDHCNQFISHLVKYKWFESYQTIEGLKKILTQMESRTQFESNLSKGCEDLVNDYFFYESHFSYFLPNIIDYLKNNN